MPSTVTTPVAMRLQNDDAHAVRHLAEKLGVPASTIGAACVHFALGEEPHTQQLLEAIELLGQRAHSSDQRERRRLVLDALAVLRGDDRP